MTGPRTSEALVAFPLPDITGDGDFMTAVPSEDPANIFGFETTVNGEAVDTELHQYAFATNIDYTAFLEDLGVPLTAVRGSETQTAINGLDDEQKAELLHRGLVIPMEYGYRAGHADRVLRRCGRCARPISWEASFPAGETVVVEHQYKPERGRHGGSDLPRRGLRGLRSGDRVQAKKYCTDEPLHQRGEEDTARSGRALWRAVHRELDQLHVVDGDRTGAGRSGRST